MASAVRPAMASLKYEAPEAKKANIWDVATRFPKEKTSDFLKFGYLPWGTVKGIAAVSGSPIDNTTLDNTAKVSKIGKLAVSSIVAGPSAFLKAGRSVSDFAEKRDAKSLGKATIDVLGTISPVVDGMELVNGNIATISEKTMHIAKGVNFGALGITMTHNAVKEGKKIHDATKIVNDTAAPETKKAVAKDKRWQAVIDLGKAVSYIALAVIGLLVTFSVFALTAPVALALTVAGTSALVFSTWGFFNANIVDPDGKKGLVEKG